MKVPRRSALPLFLLFVLLTACGPNLPSDLETPPVPDLTTVEPAVREQLGDARAQLDARLGKRTSTDELAAAFAHMGQLYHAYDLLPEAAACYRNALRLSDGNAQWRYYLGGVYRRQGELDAAAETLAEALRADLDNAPVLLRLGRVELARSRPAEARDAFERALAADPECAAARYGLGEAARAAGDLETAAAEFRRTLEQQPQAAQVLYPLGQTLQRLGREDEAAPYLERSAARRMSVGGRPTCSDPWDEELAGLTRSAAAYLTRGLHASYSGRHEEALSQYRKALEVAPEDPVVRQSLGSALAAQGDVEGALEQYREAVRLAPDDPDLNHDLGFLASRLGHPAEARRHLETALELRPGFEAARTLLASLPPAPEPPDLREDAPGHGAPGHHARGHGTRLPSSSLPPPPLMDGIGDASLPITTRSERAQQYFDQGVNLLHCFWDFEAYRAFREAIRLDPEAAMSHWGLFLSLNYNQREQLEERRRALAEASTLAPEASDREQRYIQAITRLSIEEGQAGRAAFVDEMQQLIDRYPDDLQAKLFLIKYLVTEVGGGGYSISPGESGASGFERARGMLRTLLRTHPDAAAVHHYWIHVHEYGPTPEAALASAEKLASLAPKSGHILHMPGHIYYQVGDYEKAYRAFHASLRFDRDYLERTGVEPVDNWNYTHNLDYLVANCAEDGRYQEGQKWAKVLSDLPVPAERAAAVGLGFIVYGGRTAPVRLHMRYERWDLAAAFLEQSLATWRFPSQVSADYLGGLLAYSRGMAAMQRGEAGAAASRFQEMLGLGMKLAQEESRLGSDWYFEAARRIVAIGAVELGGWVLSDQGQHDKAIAQLERAVQMETTLGYGEPPHYARPVRETLAAAYLRAGRWQDAKAAYEAALEERPGSGHALSGVARAYALGGRRTEARAAYERFLEAWRHADADLPQLAEARAWLEANR